MDYLSQAWANYDRATGNGGNNNEDGNRKRAAETSAVTQEEEVDDDYVNIGAGGKVLEMRHPMQMHHHPLRE